MKNSFLILVFILPLCTMAQYGEQIRTGRPGQSIGAYAVGNKVLQVQSGIGYTSFEEDAGLNGNILLNNNVIRYGIGERFEISSVINVRRDKTSKKGGEKSRSGLSSSQFGARINLTQNEGWLPAMCLQGRALLPLQSEEYPRDEIGSQFVFATVNKLGENWGLTSNWILRSPGNGADRLGLYTLALSYSISDQVGTFVEIFGELDGFSKNYDTGFSYLVHSNLQLDFGAGWQGITGRDEWFLDAGLSWRTDWRN